jgi:putative endonuclease
LTKPGNTIGAEAEDQALLFLQQRGLILSQRNYRCRRGEIDLIMRDGNALVFIEVRYRKNPLCGSAAESITRPKQLRIQAAAAHYLQKARGNNELPCRFDVVAITGTGSRYQDIQWIKNAFQADM